MADKQRYRTFEEFWPYYMSEHARPATRAVHLAGTGLAAACLIAFAVTGDLRLLPVALVAGYGPAWLSHLLIEKNRPATFRYPVMSLFGDLRMFALACSGRLAGELERLRREGG